MTAARGLRVAILDDSPYVAWDGRIHAVNATFHRFAAALLDVHDADGAPRVARVTMAVPVRPAADAPGTLPVDPRIVIVPTAPFDGIAGYLRRAPALAARNLPALRRAFRGADVVLLRLPASNAAVAAMLAVAMGRPRVAYVVGSVAEVAAGQARGGAAGMAARAVGLAYDGVTRLAGAGAERIVVGRLSRDSAAPGDAGIISSLVLPEEIRAPGAPSGGTGGGDTGEPAGAGARGDAAPAAGAGRPLRLAFAGRLADGKGIEDLLAAVARLREGVDGPGLDVELELLGDGPARPALELETARLGIGARVTYAGHIAQRAPYLDRLARADLFVSASPAEGFPKVVLDAMAAAVPVAAVPAGTLRALAGARATAAGPAVAAIDPAGAASIASTVRHLAEDAAETDRLRLAGHAFVTAHTMPAEAERLVTRLERAARRAAG